MRDKRMMGGRCAGEKFSKYAFSVGSCKMFCHHKGTKETNYSLAEGVH